MVDIDNAVTALSDSAGPRRCFLQLVLGDSTAIPQIPHVLPYRYGTGQQNNHFSEDFRAKNQFVDRLNKLEVFKLYVVILVVRWGYCPAEARLMLLRCAALCHHVSDSSLP